MTGVWLAVALSVVTGLLVNEICDISPWLALRMIRRAARLWSVGDHGVAEAYGEEWAAIIDDCPGKLSKVVRAAGFLGGATLKASKHRIGRPRRRSGRHVTAEIDFEALEATFRVSEGLRLQNLNPGDTVTVTFDNHAEYLRFQRENPAFAAASVKLRSGSTEVAVEYPSERSG